MSYRTEGGKLSLVVRTADGELIKTFVSGEDFFSLFIEKDFLDKNDDFIKERVVALAEKAAVSPVPMKFLNGAIVPKSIEMSEGVNQLFAPANNGIVIVDCLEGVILSAHNVEELRLINFDVVFPIEELEQVGDWSFSREMLLFKDIHGMDTLKRLYDYGRIKHYCETNEIDPFDRDLPKSASFDDIVEFAKNYDGSIDAAFVIDIDPWKYNCFGIGGDGFALTLAVANEVFGGIELSPLEKELWSLHLGGIDIAECASLDLAIGNDVRILPAKDGCGFTLHTKYGYALEIMMDLAENKRDFEFSVSKDDQMARITSLDLKALKVCAARRRWALRYFVSPRIGNKNR